MTARARFRRSSIAFALLGAGAAGLALAALHAGLSQTPGQARMEASAALVRHVGLTDLALFTEARYTRHPAMADLHSPFQDNPMAFEHFPSGTFAPLNRNFGRGTLGFDESEVAR
ncbi:hypothetical protein [Sinisalibacter lacisalsi]|uniref:Uncharacterized protein n=1 Tax=Sinisalibacter lacisalsi TaxID=1526570 RepID=A0ABQ1QNT7_9RHOB|nr:hypothetical protein [Sinisalibacter lacisalsi]GGD38581.1 hypothetical protein GCM10011358_23050 [Sinisalibacter lacisalsi]